MAGRKKGGAKKVTAKKKPLYICARHGYETDATASRESQMSGKAKHLGKRHGGRGTAKHRKRSAAVRNSNHAAHDEDSVVVSRTSVRPHVRVSGSRSHSISVHKVQSLKKTWLHDAADAEPRVADAIVKCVNDLNTLLG